MRAYLDIETAFDGSISIIGIYRPDHGTIQLVGGGVRDVPLYEALSGVTTVVTFNGSSFDLPIIRKRLYANLQRDFEHCDLLYICRRRGLRGGLKRVETLLGIARTTAGISGWDAPRLWNRYETTGDRAATTIAPQALLMLNSDLVQQASDALAERVSREGESLPQRIERLFALCYSRPATAKEIAAAEKFLRDAQKILRASLSSDDEAASLAWRSYCQSILAANEFIYVR